jgi:hypothetical protein
MHAGLPAVLALLAPAASADPPAAPVARPQMPAATAQDGCRDPRPRADTTQIVICAQKPQGFRLNPDVMEAKREVHDGGRPHNPHESFRDYPCASGIGPAPCFNAGINLIAAALTATEMARRIAAGKPVGSMFVTDPHPTEYQLYQMAKARREAREKEQAAAKKATATAAAAGKVDTPAPDEAKEPAAK